MKLFLFLFIAASLSACKSRTKTPAREFYSKDFNWRITIPEGFDSVSAEQWAKMQNRGLEAIEKTYGAGVENRSKTIFVFQSDKFNYFESNWQPYDSATDGNYVENFRGVNDILYRTFEAQMPDAKLDSVSSEETIDGLTFQTFTVKVTMPNKMVMDLRLFSRVFGKREFSVNISTVDRVKQDLLLRTWRNSTFSGQ